MLSFSYLKYIIKSKKYLLLVATLLCVAIVISSQYSMLYSNRFDYTLAYLLGVSIVLSYILPCLVFSYMHDKKAIDTYFAIPISRKQAIITGLIACIILAYVPYAVGTTLFVLTETILTLRIVLYYVITLLVIVTLISFNTLLFSLANTVFDGVVMIGAYSFLPLCLFFALSIFLYEYVCGYNDSLITFVQYLSPVASGIGIYDKIDELSFDCEFYTYLISLLIFLIGSLTILIKSYINRKVERANTSSSMFFAYPFVIYAYTFLCLFEIFSGYAYGQSLVDFFLENLVMYVILFVIFVVAHFVYKRKFYFSIKSLIYYLAASLLFFAVCSGARSTNGFGIANIYPKYNEKTYYKYHTYYYDGDNDIAKWLSEKTETKTSFVDVSIEAGNGKNELNKESVELFENLRLIAIKEFYNKNTDAREINIYSNMRVYDDYFSDENDRYYFYDLENHSLSLEDIMALAKDKYVTITLGNDEALYVLRSDGSLIQREYYMDIAIE